MHERDQGTSRYIRTAMSREMLDAETERELAMAWRDHRDEAALHRLIRAYTRLAISIAGRFRRYAVPYEDLVQQGNLGLMRAAEKYDPDNGARFSTYATWWIRASMQDYVMRNWSLVRTGTNASQKKLFFHLRRVQNRMEADSSRDETLSTSIARELMVPEEQVEMMLGRMAGPDLSLNAPQSDGEGTRDWMELLQDEAPATEDEVLDRMEARDRHRMLHGAVRDLPDRERLIVTRRHLDDTPTTLNELGDQLGISKERVRQLEERALARIGAQLRDALPEPATA